MPIYAFRCEACGHSFDRLQKLSDPDPVECPECGAPAIKRQVTAPAFRLAGSGWYETDFKSGKDKQRNLAGRDEPAQAADKGRAAAEPGAGKGGAEAPSGSPKEAPKSAPAPASGPSGVATDK